MRITMESWIVIAFAVIGSIWIAAIALLSEAAQP
jgi:hypothetical protein